MAEISIKFFQEIGALNKDTVYRSRSNATYQIATADLSWKLTVT